MDFRFWVSGSKFGIGHEGSGWPLLFAQKFDDLPYSSGVGLSFDDEVVEAESRCIRKFEPDPVLDVIDSVLSAGYRKRSQRFLIGSSSLIL